MRRARRLTVALFVVASLAAAHGGSGLVRSLASDSDGTYCCCPSPDECHCTANCCNHGTARAADRDGSEGASLKSSVSCHFPSLPDGSLSGAVSHELAKAPASDGERTLAPPDSSRGRLERSIACESAGVSSSSSPRAPPVLPRVRC